MPTGTCHSHSHLLKTLSHDHIQQQSSLGTATELNSHVSNYSTINIVVQVADEGEDELLYTASCLHHNWVAKQIRESAAECP